MRTDKQWEGFVFPKALKTFSPRLQRDVVKFDFTPPKEDPDKPGSFFFYGSSNTGKTTLAAQMFLAALKRRYYEKLHGAYIWTTSYDFFASLRKTYDDPELDEYAVMDKYASAAQLYIDDLGDIKITDWGLSQLQTLINKRYESLLPMVITSNLGLQELADLCGDDRLPSRITRICKVMEVEK